jgi:hypothetical protein
MTDPDFSEFDTLLRDGRAVHVRAVRAADEGEILQAACSGWSAGTLQARTRSFASRNWNVLESVATAAPDAISAAANSNLRRRGPPVLVATKLAGPCRPAPVRAQRQVHDQDAAGVVASPASCVAR